MLALAGVSAFAQPGPLPASEARLVEALREAERLNGPQHLEVARRLDALAEWHASQGRLAQALLPALPPVGVSEGVGAAVARGWAAVEALTPIRP